MLFCSESAAAGRRGRTESDGAVSTPASATRSWRARSSASTASGERTNRASLMQSSSELTLD